MNKYDVTFKFVDKERVMLKIRDRRDGEETTVDLSCDELAELILEKRSHRDEELRHRNNEM